MKNLFFGGIHPKYNKEMSTKMTKLQTIVPKQVIIPMQQHIGTACKPLVQVGEKVLRGQKIGDGENLCVPVHASVSGTVVAIEQRPHPVLGQCMAVVIENDYQDTSVQESIAVSTEEMLIAIREAGIVGMGGAAFPGNVKALTAMGKVDTLIGNACECEPYITADDFLLRIDTEVVLEGMMIMSQLLNTQRIVLAIEDNKEEAIIEIKERIKNFPQVELFVLPTKYPQGAEKQLIQSVTAREVLPGQLPVSVGCAVFNVSTFAAIYRAVRMGIPLTERIVTVSGEGIEKPQNFLVRIGTPFQDLLEAAGGLNNQAECVISGGPMMGIAQEDMSVPVVKATNAILCMIQDRNSIVENSVCLHCGKCSNVCPMRLQPLYMYRYVKAKRIKELERLNLIDCIECGCCGFTCPGKLPLVENFRKGKKMLKEAKWT